MVRRTARHVSCNEFHVDRSSPKNCKICVVNTSVDILIVGIGDGDGEIGDMVVVDIVGIVFGGLGFPGFRLLLPSSIFAAAAAALAV